MTANPVTHAAPSLGRSTRTPWAVHGFIATSTRMLSALTRIAAAGQLGPASDVDLSRHTGSRI